MDELVAEMLEEGIPGVSVAWGHSADEEAGTFTGGTALPPGGVPVARDTLFDLASITKLFTAMCAMILSESGDLEIDSSVGAFFPEAASSDVTLRGIMTHSAGLPAVSTLWKCSTDAAHARSLLLEVAPVLPAGTRHLYSCVGYAVLGLVIERATGMGLDRVVQELIGDPLGMRSLCYATTGHVPEGATFAATETRPESDPWRPGTCVGQVHDEMAWALGGVSGNAGLFSTAEDLLKFAQMLAQRGVDIDGKRVVGQETFEAMVLPDPSVPQPVSYVQGLGPRLGMKELTGTTRSTLVGHTGFTGTAMVADTREQRAAVILTNGTFPDRSLIPVAPRLRPSMCRLLKTNKLARTVSAAGDGVGVE